MKLENRLKGYLASGVHESQFHIFTGIYNTLSVVIDGGRGYSDIQSKTLSEALSLTLPAFREILTQLESVGSGDLAKDLGAIVRTKSALIAFEDETLDLLESSIFSINNAPREFQVFRSACYNVSSQLSDTTHEYCAQIHKHIDYDNTVLKLSAV
ncbi:hypothetical protein [Alteromonas stellipolaris]|uniref:Uncharacterized protein n=1 Tax=Alteromonas stellipolaris TaxID=233316 RepID=A0ABM5YH92_9ALTE|nr:hypothetical protein [Alteromonas stellipolaris]AMJ73673.1 hypothetical protein AVL57_06585 [Alteromonas stellipolaris]